ncbi:hypothetical protein D3C73_1505730 [compost metagenome]
MAANTLEWQLAGLREALDFAGAGQHHDGGLGQQLFAIPGLPMALGSTQLQHIVMGQQPNSGAVGLPLTQRRGMRPATFREKQAA